MNTVTPDPTAIGSAPHDIEQAWAALVAFAGPITRDQASDLLPHWSRHRDLTDELRRAVLARFAAPTAPPLPEHVDGVRVGGPVARRGSAALPHRSSPDRIAALLDDYTTTPDTAPTAALVAAVRAVAGLCREHRASGARAVPVRDLDQALADHLAEGQPATVASSDSERAAP